VSLIGKILLIITLCTPALSFAKSERKKECTPSSKSSRCTKSASSKSGSDSKLPPDCNMTSTCSEKSDFSNNVGEIADAIKASKEADDNGDVPSYVTKRDDSTQAYASWEDGANSTSPITWTIPQKPTLDDSSGPSGSGINDAAQ
jgi:hypothetical protein